MAWLRKSRLCDRYQSHSMQQNTPAGGHVSIDHRAHAPSRWIDCNEFEKFAEAIRSMLTYVLQEAVRTVSGSETPFGPDTVLVEFRTGRAASGARPWAADHPAASTCVDVPRGGRRGVHPQSPGSTLGWTDVPQFGCWYPSTCREAGRLSHIQLSFRMRCTDREWSSASLQWSVARANWVRQRHISRPEGRLHVGNSAGHDSDLRRLRLDTALT